MLEVAGLLRLRLGPPQRRRPPSPRWRAPREREPPRPPPDDVRARRLRAAAPRDARPATGVALLPVARRARDRVPRARRVGRPALDVDARARRARPRLDRALRRRCSRSRRCSAPGGSRAAGATLAAVAAIVPLVALMLLAGRVADELLLPGGWNELAGGISRGISDLPGVRVPYRGLDDWVRTVIPLGGSALVLLAALLAFWPRRDRLGFPGVGAAAADRALRRAGRRAGLQRRVPARRGLHAADGRLPAPGEAAPAGLAGGGRARGRGDARRAGRRAGAQPRHALVRLRDVGAGDVVVEVDLVHLEPQLRRAQLAARRPRAAAGEGQAARLLEGREPRRLRRRASGGARTAGSPCRSSRPTSRRSSSAGRSRSRSRSATCARTSSSPRATRPSSRSRS